MYLNVYSKFGFNFKLVLFYSWWQKLSDEKSKLQLKLGNKHINKPISQSINKDRLGKELEEIKIAMKNTQNEITDLANKISESFTKRIHKAISQWNEDKLNKKLLEFEDCHKSITQNIENIDEDRIKELYGWCNCVFKSLINSNQEKALKVIYDSNKKIWNIIKTSVNATQDLNSIVEIFDKNHDFIQDVFKKWDKESTELIKKTLKIK